tara:strand:- start:121 stop:546 length:426 start_codon:yes stop_codon:yes gene_type:complete
MENWNYNTAKVGDRIPHLTLEPISRTTLALYAGASGDHNSIHIDLDFAKKSGLPDVIAHGMLVMAYLGRALTNIIQQAAIQEIGVQFSSMTQIGDTLTCSGVVIEQINNDELKSITLDLVVSDSKGDKKLSGHAIIKLKNS